ncbi:MAG: ester cyclase, partial [Gemmatimonadota bacterium]
TGQMGPFPPSGKQLELPFIGLLRVENGKIAEIWVEWDNLNALAQLGHFPPPGMIPEEETPDVE